MRQLILTFIASTLVVTPLALVNGSHIDTMPIQQQCLQYPPEYFPLSYHHDNQPEYVIADILPYLNQFTSHHKWWQNDSSKVEFVLEIDGPGHDAGSPGRTIKTTSASDVHIIDGNFYTTVLTGIESLAPNNSIVFTCEFDLHIVLHFDESCQQVRYETMTTGCGGGERVTFNSYYVPAGLFVQTILDPSEGAALLFYINYGDNPSVDFFGNEVQDAYFTSVRNQDDLWTHDLFHTTSDDGVTKVNVHYEQ